MEAQHEFNARGTVDAIPSRFGGWHDLSDSADSGAKSNVLRDYIFRPRSDLLFSAEYRACERTKSRDRRQRGASGACGRFLF